MKLIPYEDKYIHAIRALHETQDYPRMQDITVENLPFIGFIAIQGKTAVAAGFLRQVEGNFGQIDTLVSNKNFSPEDRHIAVSAVVEALINEARLLGFRGLFASTADKSVIDRALKIGFRIIPQTIISLMLEDVH